MIKAIRELLGHTAFCAGAMQGASFHLPPEHRENFREASAKLVEGGVEAVLADVEYTDAIRKLLEAASCFDPNTLVLQHKDCDCRNCRLTAAARTVAEFT